MNRYHEDDEGNLLLDEQGNPIPMSICLCFAHSSSECACGAWSYSDD